MFSLYLSLLLANRFNPSAAYDLLIIVCNCDQLDSKFDKCLSRYAQLFQVFVEDGGKEEREQGAGGRGWGLLGHQSRRASGAGYRHRQRRS